MFIYFSQVNNLTFCDLNLWFSMKKDSVCVIITYTKVNELLIEDHTAENFGITNIHSKSFM